MYIEELEGTPGHLGLLLLLPLAQNIMLIDTQPIMVMVSLSRVEWQ
jgi:hypothetical protein